MRKVPDKIESFFNDRRGLANELLYAVFVLAVMAVLWMALGPGVSKILELANSLAADGMLSPILLETLTTIVWLFYLFPVLTCICVGAYLLRRSVRRSPGDDF